jgi:hypothetical protein
MLPASIRWRHSARDRSSPGTRPGPAFVVSHRRPSLLDGGLADDGLDPSFGAATGVGSLAPAVEAEPAGAGVGAEGFSAAAGLLISWTFGSGPGSGAIRSLASLTWPVSLLSIAADSISPAKNSLMTSFSLTS